MTPEDYYSIGEQIVKTLSEFKTTVDQIDAYAKGKNLSAFWRGQMDHRWPLTSSLVRKLAVLCVPDDKMLNEVEDRLLEEASNWIEDLKDPTYAKPLAKLAYMQHHGIPTRLLDFSSNPWIALFFASEAADDVDGRLFVLLVDKGDVLTAMPDGTPWRKYSTTKIAICDAVACGVPFPRIVVQKGVLAVGRLPSTQPHRECKDTLSQGGKRSMLAEETRRILSIPFRINGSADALPQNAKPPVGLTLRIHIDKESVRRDLDRRSSGRRISPAVTTTNHRTVYPDAAGMADFSQLVAGLSKGVLVPK